MISSTAKTVILYLARLLVAQNSSVYSASRVCDAYFKFRIRYFLLSVANHSLEHEMSSSHMANKMSDDYMGLPNQDDGEALYFFVICSLWI